MAFALLTRRSVARPRAPPPMTALRLPKVPVPCWMALVSPWRTTTRSMDTRSFSATTWANTVSCPCPWELAPVSTVISPVRSTRTVPLSKPAPPLGSVKVEMPTPMSSPRVRASSRARMI